MKFSSLQYQPISTLPELAHRMERVAKLGYQGIELTACHPLGYAIEDVAALSERFHLPVVSLLSGWSYSNEGLCLCSREVRVRAAAVERLIGYAKLAAGLGAVVVVGLMQGLRQDEPDEAAAQERIAECLRRAAPTVHGLGASLVIEPVNHLQVGFNHTAADVAALVDSIGSPAVSYMLDTIHMNIEERSVIDTIRTHGPRIRHFHLCESNGGQFGTGNLDFAAVLAALDDAAYQGFVSVKIYRGGGWEQSARAAIEFLAQHGQSPR